jgi:hypothetical protein
VQQPAAEVLAATPFHGTPVDGQAVHPVVERLYGLGELLEIRLALNLAASAAGLENRRQKEAGNVTLIAITTSTSTSVTPRQAKRAMS